ncbi:MAG: hypothetical protein SPI65_06070 [Peptoniphilus sp.]|nr:FtsX-like permease family protein [Peptoniphilus sp.]MDY6045123.1 hypothetical protein [Peptoniphilus sp.]
MMRESLYTKLAKSGVKREKKLYFPFALTGSVFLILMILMDAIATEDAIASMAGMTTMTTILGLGVIVVGIFAVIALTSGYRFIRKERSEEEGLLMVLGMERRQLRRVERRELIYLFVSSSAFAILAGVILYRLALGAFLALMNVETKVIEGRILPNLGGVVRPLIAYVIIFFILYVSSARKKNIAEEMREARAGEREGRFPVLKGLLGILLIAAGYWISLTVQDPLAALGKFFVAVVLVIAGTYLAIGFLVTLIVKLLKGNKDFYLKPKNFAAIAGLNYRMRYGARSLAAIAILSTCFVVVFMSGVSLFIGGKDLIETLAPSDLQISVYNDPQAAEHLGEVEKILQKKDPRLHGARIDTLSGFVGEDGQIVTNASAMREKKAVYTSFYLAEDAPAFRGNDLLRIGKTTEEGPFRLEGTDYRVGGASDYALSVGDPALYIVEKHRDYLVKDEEMFKTVEKMFKDKDPGTNRIATLSFEKPRGSDTASSYEEIENLGFKPRIIDKEEVVGEYNQMYGAIFFTGICLAVAFLFFTGFSIYNKQLTEGHADRERFEILRDLGMTRKEAERVITTQIRTVFMIPIVFCTLHVAFAYPIVEKMLHLVGLNNQKLFILCVLGSLVFYYLFYFAVYQKTSGTYRELVLEKRP